MGNAKRINEFVLCGIILTMIAIILQSWVMRLIAMVNAAAGLQIAIKENENGKLLSIIMLIISGLNLLKTGNIINILLNAAMIYGLSIVWMQLFKAKEST